MLQSVSLSAVIQCQVMRLLDLLQEEEEYQFTEQIVLIFLISQLMKEQGLLKLSGSRQRIKMRSTVQRLIYMQAIEKDLLLIFHVCLRKPI